MVLVNSSDFLQGFFTPWTIQASHPGCGTLGVGTTRARPGFPKALPSAAELRSRGCHGLGFLRGKSDAAKDLAKSSPLEAIDVGKTMPPTRTGNGKHTTYKNGDDWRMVYPH